MGLAGGASNRSEPGPRVTATVQADDVLRSVADVCRALTASDGVEALLDALARTVPCDATSLLRLERDTLVPVMTRGLRPEALDQRFDPRHHPRLRRILAADGPVRFDDCDLPDPFDGLVDGVPGQLNEVHACMGAALRGPDGAIGVLTIDALDARAFATLDDPVFETFAALGASAIRLAPSPHAPLHPGPGPSAAGLVCASEAARALEREIAAVAPADVDVLLTGEAGAGKKRVAAEIHARSRRRRGPYLVVNCAALSTSGAERDLFGHDHPGRLAAADGGTLVLHQIGELPPESQARLLHVLQTGELPARGKGVRRVDVRVIATTSRDLRAEVSAGNLRDDLYHRLTGYPIQVPPLRDRAADVLILAEGFLLEAAGRFARTSGCIGKTPFLLTPGAVNALMTHRWPDNVRELEAVMLRAAARSCLPSGSRELWHAWLP